MCRILLLPLGPRDNRCVYMAQVCFYVCCSDYVVVCENVCCVVCVIEDCGCLSLVVLKYICVGEVMEVLFSV